MRLGSEPLAWPSRTAYNHYHNRLGHSLPKTAAVLLTNRPTGVNHHMVWETLTHAEVGAVELPPVVAR